ncbi:MAG: disulfide reductase [Thermoproteota archaeon]|nr:MAG: disulfide reductase [Candidatus Korarchaeota archaeon]
MGYGVFICHCGQNIAGTIDVKKLVEKVSEISGVTHVEDYIFMCSDPGQERIKKAIREKNLEGIVVAACSPSLHEETFRRAAESVGLNPYLVEIANIREWSAWPHQGEPEEATEKAFKIIESAVEKLNGDKPLEPLRLEVVRRVMVIGGGIAGIQAALDVADAGIEVILVERSSSIGGRMAQLSETFPTLDCPQCILTPKMTSVAHHPLVKLLAYSEVEEVTGSAGNFKVKVRRKPTYVDWDKCVGCGLCMEACPVKVPSEFEMGLAHRKAIYIPFPQAVPNKAVIDAENCIRMEYGKGCGLCAQKCPANAITFEDNGRVEEYDVGAIIVATGLEVMDKANFAEYGAGELKDVLTGLEFERMLAPSGPTGGRVVRPSDGRVPKEIVFIQCVGSRDPENWNPYCSKICCMYTAKQALLYKHAVPDGQAYIFYIDIRADGKGYEEFIHRAMAEEGVIYLRGRVGRVYQEGDKLRVEGVDTIAGLKIVIDADMVVLATAAVPSNGVEELAKKLRIQLGEGGWLKEAHLKLRPLETLTSGVFIAGAAQYPKDITDTVSHASGAAAKAVAFLSKGYVMREPLIAVVDEEICSGCGNCEEACSYQAIKVVDRKARVDESLCEGCGSCTAACPSGAVQLKNYDKRQIIKMVESIVG